MSRFFIAALLEVVFFCSVLASSDSELDDVKSRHQATVDGFSSLRIKLRVSYEPALAFGTENIDYWMDGDEVRRKYQTTNGQRGDTHQKGDISKSFSRIKSPNELMVDSGEISTRNVPMYADPKLLCLLTVPGTNQFRVPLATALNEPHKLNGLRKISESGKEYDVIALTHQRAKIEIWLSKAHNYLISKLIIWTSDDAKYPFSEDVVERFVGVLPGVYFPSIIRSTNYSPADGKVISVRTVAVDEVQVNQPIPRSQLTFQFPPNLTVVDAVQNKVWKTGPNGELGVEAKTADGVALTIGQPGPLPAEATPADAVVATATREEPKSLTRWVLPASLGLIAAGLGLYLVRFYRARRA